MVGMSAPPGARAQSYAELATDYSGAFYVDTTYPAWTDSSGNTYDPWSKALMISLDLGGHAGRYRGFATASYLTTPTETEHLAQPINGQSTCTFTYSVDQSQPLRPVMTVTGGVNASLSLSYQEKVQDSCLPDANLPDSTLSFSWRPQGVLLPKTALFFAQSHPLVYDFRSDPTTTQFPAGPSTGPSTVTTSGDLYIGGFWTKAKAVTKDEQQRLLEQQYRAALDDCETQTLYALASPLLRAFSPYISQSECEETARLIFWDNEGRIDPPDRNYNAVALPGVAPSIPPARACARLSGAERRRCASVAAAMQRYAGAVAAAANIEAVVVTTLNRGNTATAAGAQAGAQLQQTVLLAYAVERQAAMKATRAAAVALKRSLAAAGLRATWTAGRARRAMAALRAGRLPGNVLAALRAAGISRAAIAKAMRAALGKARPQAGSLSATLVPPQPPALIPVRHMIFGPAQLVSVVEGLAQGGTLTSAQSEQLLADVSGAEGAASRSAKAAALARLRSDLADLPTQARTFMRAALQQLGP